MKATSLNDLSVNEPKVSDDFEISYEYTNKRMFPRNEESPILRRKVASFKHAEIDVRILNETAVLPDSTILKSGPKMNCKNFRYFKHAPKFF